MNPVAVIRVQSNESMQSRRSRLPVGEVKPLEKYKTDETMNYSVVNDNDDVKNNNNKHSMESVNQNNKVNKAGGSRIPRSRRHTTTYIPSEQSVISSMSPTSKRPGGNIHDLDRKVILEQCEDLTSWVRGLLNLNGVDLDTDLRRSMMDGRTLPLVINAALGASLESAISTSDNKVGCIRSCLLYLSSIGLKEKIIAQELIDGDLQATIIVISFIKDQSMGQSKSKTSKSQSKHKQERTTTNVPKSPVTDKLNPELESSRGQHNNTDVKSQRKVLKTFRQPLASDSMPQTRPLRGIMKQTSLSVDQLMEQDSKKYTSRLGQIQSSSSISINVDSGEQEFDDDQPAPPVSYIPRSLSHMNVKQKPTPMERSLSSSQSQNSYITSSQICYKPAHNQSLTSNEFTANQTQTVYSTSQLRRSYEKPGNQSQALYGNLGNQSQTLYEYSGNKSQVSYGQPGNQSQNSYAQSGNQSQTSLYEQPGNQSQTSYGHSLSQLKSLSKDSAFSTVTRSTTFTYKDSNGYPFMTRGQPSGDSNPATPSGNEHALLQDGTRILNKADNFSSSDITPSPSPRRQVPRDVIRSVIRNYNTKQESATGSVLSSQDARTPPQNKFTRAQSLDSKASEPVADGDGSTGITDHIAPYNSNDKSDKSSDNRLYQSFTSLPVNDLNNENTTNHKSTAAKVDSLSTHTALVSGDNFTFYQNSADPSQFSLNQPKYYNVTSTDSAASNNSTTNQVAVDQNSASFLGRCYSPPHSSNTRSAKSTALSHRLSMPVAYQFHHSDSERRQVADETMNGNENLDREPEIEAAVDVDQVGDLESSFYDNDGCNTPSLPALTDNTDIESMAGSQINAKYTRSASVNDKLLYQDTPTNDNRQDADRDRLSVDDEEVELQKFTSSKPSRYVRRTAALRSQGQKKSAGLISSADNVSQPLQNKIIKIEQQLGDLMLFLGVDGSSQSDSKRNSITDSVNSSQLSYSLKPGKKYKHFKAGSNGSTNKRLHRLESHIVTLARSVSHMSSEVKSLYIQLEDMCREMDSLKQSNGSPSISEGISSSSTKPQASTSESQANEKSDIDVKRLPEPKDNTQRFTKLTRFFGQEPPLMKLFLKQLGYEQYNELFEGEQIGMLELRYMTDDKLRSIGIPLGPRVRILQEAQSIKLRMSQLNGHLKLNGKHGKSK